MQVSNKHPEWGRKRSEKNNVCDMNIYICDGCDIKRDR